MRKNELIEGKHYYIDDRGKWVFTSYFLLNRGYCCQNGCLHCPYKKSNSIQSEKQNPMKIEPGQYIWRSKNSDLSVTVVEVLGEGADGRVYVKILDSSTAIPADELVRTSRPTQESRRPNPQRLF